VKRISINQKYFVILFIGRDGSSAITSSINKHPDLFCYPEVFANRNDIKQNVILQDILNGNPLEEKYPKIFDGYSYEKKYKLHNNKLYKSIGIKIKIIQPKDFDYLKAFLEKYDFKVIQLIRRNIVKGAISILNRHRLQEKFGVPNTTNKSQTQNEPFYVDPKKFINVLKARMSYLWMLNDFASKISCEKIEIEYENFLLNRVETINTIFEFMNVENFSVSSDFVKNTPNELDKIVKNLDELKDEIHKNSNYAYCLKYFK